MTTKVLVNNCTLSEANMLQRAKLTKTKNKVELWRYVELFQVADCLEVVAESIDLLYQGGRYCMSVMSDLRTVSLTRFKCCVILKAFNNKLLCSKESF